jgi:DNA repair protein RadC
MYLIKEMPKEERPRERLIHYGVKSLSNEELIAILLRTGRKDLSVVELSKHVLYHLESLSDLKRMTVQELLQINGIKEAKATTLIAAIELGKRLSELKNTDKVKIASALDVYHLFHHDLSHLLQEHFICIYLNTKAEIIKKETIFIGTINQTIIHPREIFKDAVKLSAAAILFVHNHPTGDSTPSKADLAATDLLSESANLMGIDLIDHIIIGSHEYYSIKERKRVKI